MLKHCSSEAEGPLFSQTHFTCVGKGLCAAAFGGRLVLGRALLQGVVAASGRAVAHPLWWWWQYPGSGHSPGSSLFECSSLSKTTTSERPAASSSDGFSFQTTSCPEGPDSVLGMASQTVTTVQPQFSAVQQPGQWQTGLLNCCSDCGVCEYTRTPHSCCCS